MISMVTAWGIGKFSLYVGGSIAAFVIAWILKRIPNERIYRAVEKFFHGVGVCLTITASKKSKLWNKIIEAWIIDLFHNTVMAALKGLIRGLKSDN